MPPLITHLVIAEQVWPLLAPQWGEAYGDFLLGNLVVDVDKFCPDLDKVTTHMFDPKETHIWLAECSRRFIDQQAELMRAPFPEITPAEQAFALGYLCHLAADEATTGRYEAFRIAREERMGAFPSDEAIGTVVDETAAGLLQDRQRILTALENSRMPRGLLLFVPHRCLEAMRWILFPLIRKGGGFEAYIGLVRRNSLWHRHGQLGDGPVDEDLEAKLIPYRQRLLEAKAEAREAAAEFDIASIIAASLGHCRMRLTELAGVL